jgi:hypothetical protein
MNSELTAWQIRHGVTHAALADLRAILMPSTDTPTAAPAKSESYVQSVVRLTASQAGMRLWRNNVGGGVLENGSYIRWGLCNDTPQLNKVIKSSDLIGLHPITITPAHVGSIIGQFVARECKHSAWKYTGDEREVAQLKFINLVRSLGGDAAFTTGNL